MTRSVGALYLHVPFCKQKCLYCDFASTTTRVGSPRMGLYVEGLVRELAMLSERGLLRDCHTVYIGGGTPTFLGADLLCRLISRAREACTRVEELTFEANPDSLTDEVIQGARQAGATRVSIGVQSLCDAELKSLGRVHTAAQAAERVRAAVASGMDVSVDLMCAIPQQTDESWIATLASVLDLGVCHVSVYPLAIEPETPFGRAYGDEVQSWNDEDVQARRMERAREVLESAGFERYEVASYARAGHDCKHNQAYWTGITYLGLGDGASSMLERDHYLELAETLDRLPPLPEDTVRIRLSRGKSLAYEFINERQAWAEDLMLGMRMVRGVDISRVPAPVVADLAKRGLVALEGGRMKPTHDGWLLGNELYGTLWDLAGDPVVEGTV